MRPYIVPRLRFATCGIFDGCATNGAFSGVLREVPSRAGIREVF
jgi:hypothetical protein